MKNKKLSKLYFRAVAALLAPILIGGCAKTHPSTSGNLSSVQTVSELYTKETDTTELNDKDNNTSGDTVVIPTESTPNDTKRTPDQTATEKTEPDETTIEKTESSTPVTTSEATSAPPPDTDKPADTSESQDPVPVTPKNGFNGICFAIPGAQSRGIDVDRLFDLLETMNVGALRNWMHATEILSSPTEINEKQYNRQKQWISALNKRGITKIVGMSHYWFWPEGYNCTDHAAVPYWSDNPNSDFRKWLDVYEQTWYTLASLFPEIDCWEIGNEFNMNSFLHPRNYYSTNIPFTLEEKAEIVTEMCYAASKAIHRANPNATVIFPAMAPEGGFTVMENFLEMVYNNIESGKYGNGSTDSDDYFDAMAWHCYIFNEPFNIDKWIRYNNAVYAVMQKHGDGDKKVFLTEYGFSDGGSQKKDAEQAEYLKQIYDACKNKMTYVDSVYPFRLIEDETAASWGGTIEIYYGMFRVFGISNFGAKEKAKAVCECYGGNVSKLDRYIGNYSVYDSN